jgi:hypothetical protein
MPILSRNELAGVAVTGSALAPSMGAITAEEIEKKLANRRFRK